MYIAEAGSCGLRRRRTSSRICTRPSMAVGSWGARASAFLNAATASSRSPRVPWTMPMLFQMDTPTWRLFGGLGEEVHCAFVVAFEPGERAAVVKRKSGVRVFFVEFLDEFVGSDDFRILDGLAKLLEVLGSVKETRPMVRRPRHPSPRLRRAGCSISKGSRLAAAGSTLAGHGMRVGRPKNSSSHEFDSIQRIGAAVMGEVTREGGRSIVGRRSGVNRGGRADAEWRSRNGAGRGFRAVQKNGWNRWIKRNTEGATEKNLGRIRLDQVGFDRICRDCDRFRRGDNCLK